MGSYRKGKGNDYISRRKAFLLVPIASHSDVHSKQHLKNFSPVVTIYFLVIFANRPLGNKFAEAQLKSYFEKKKSYFALLFDTPNFEVKDMGGSSSGTAAPASFKSVSVRIMVHTPVRGTSEAFVRLAMGPDHGMKVNARIGSTATFQLHT